MKTKRIFFMMRKLLNDIFSGDSPYKVTDDLDSEKLGYYYFLFEEDPAKLNRLISNFDKSGIPVNSSYIDVDNPKPHYYPISIGQYGLAVFNSYMKTQDPKKKEHFLRIANWFVENKTEDNNMGTYWLTDIPKPEYKVYEAWKSAFTQSRAISILLRAWQITNDDRYFQIAENSLISFESDIKEGGVAVISEYGKFYEEYVANEPTMVLDGHIFSLLGLYDFHRAAKNVNNLISIKSKSLFDDGINALIKLLPEYDMGFWVRFNLCKMKHYPEIDPCTIGYLKLISLQLDLLYRITHHEILKKYSTRFINYKTIPNILRMLFIKYKALKKLNRL